MLLGFILVISLFLTGLVTYNLWMKRADTKIAVESFKTHLVHMQKDTENITNWNRDLNKSLQFMISDNEVLKKELVEFGAKDEEIKTELAKL